MDTCPNLHNMYVHMHVDNFVLYDFILRYWIIINGGFKHCSFFYISDHDVEIFVHIDLFLHAISEMTHSHIHFRHSWNKNALYSCENSPFVPHKDVFAADNCLYYCVANDSNVTKMIEFSPWVKITIAFVWQTKYKFVELKAFVNNKTVNLYY